MDLAVALQHDLLAQARQLATDESTVARQAVLRVALSTAYYALFQLLVAEATRSIAAGSSGCIACTGWARVRP